MLRKRRLEEKQSYLDELKGEWDMHTVGNVVMCLGDFCGHVGGINGIHGGNVIGQRNLEGRMSLEFCQEKELCVTNT